MSEPLNEARARVAVAMDAIDDACRAEPVLQSKNRVDRANVLGRCVGENGDCHVPRCQLIEQFDHAGQEFEVRGHQHLAIVALLLDGKRAVHVDPPTRLDMPVALRIGAPGHR